MPQWAGHMAYNGKLVNVYRVLVQKGTRGRPSGIWEIVLKLILKNLRSCIKKFLNWIRDLGFLAEERDNWHAVVNRAMNCPVHKVIRIY
jgi:predicted ArsR family transcriptional regulator